MAKDGKTNDSMLNCISLPNVYPLSFCYISWVFLTVILNFALPNSRDCGKIEKGNCFWREVVKKSLEKDQKDMASLEFRLARRPLLSLLTSCS